MLHVAHKKPDVQNLFGIVQGGLDPVLRLVCVASCSTSMKGTHSCNQYSLISHYATLLIPEIFA